MIVNQKEVVESIISSLMAGNEPNIPDEFKKIIIKIEGLDQDGTIDARTAQSIVRLQQTVYHLAAFALIGPDATAKDLNSDQLDKLRLKFSTSPGCTEISARLWQTFTYILAEYTKNMTPNQKILVLFLLLCTFLCYVGGNSAAEYLKQSAELQTRVLQSQEETKRLQAVLNHAHTAGETVAFDFGKAVKGASSLRVGAKSFTEEELTQLQKRAERVPAEFENDAGVFTIIGVKSLKKRLSVTMKSVETGEEVTAFISPNDLFSDEEGIPKTPPAIADFIDKDPVSVTMLVKITKSKTERLITSWTPAAKD